MLSSPQIVQLIIAINAMMVSSKHRANGVRLGPRPPGPSPIWVRSVCSWGPTGPLAPWPPGPEQSVNGESSESFEMKMKV